MTAKLDVSTSYLSIEPQERASLLSGRFMTKDIFVAYGTYDTIHGHIMQMPWKLGSGIHAGRGKLLHKVFYFLEFASPHENVV
jgi:hypothetical protein